MNPNSPNIPPQQLARFLRTLLPLEVELDETLLGRLHRYIARQLDGERYQTQDPDLAVLLDRDPALAEAYAVLYDLEEAVRSASLPAANVSPVPDLSFLNKTAAQAVRSWVERAGEQILIHLTAALLDTLPPLQPAVGLRQADVGRYGEQLYTLAGQALSPPQPVAVNVYADREQPGMVLLEVEVALPDKAWPNLAGVPVTLAVQGLEQMVLTDPWGTAVFEDLPRTALSDLQIAIDLDPSSIN